MMRIAAGWWTEGGSYPVPVAIVDGEGNAARDVTVAQIITQTHLSVFDLQEGRHVRSDTSNKKHKKGSRKLLVYRRKLIPPY